MNKMPRTLIRYLLLTFGITGVSWWLLALLTSKGVVVPGGVPYRALHVLGGFGPTLAALSCLAPRDKRSIVRFIFHARKGSLRYLIILSLLFTLTIAAGSDGLNPEIPWFVVPIIFVSTTLIGGGNEELGWRGTLQPTLERYVPFPVATLITGCLWGLWHLPLWFIDGMAQREVPFPMFLAFGLVLSFYLAGLYAYSRSVWHCMLFHGLSNTLISIVSWSINFWVLTGLVVLLILSILMGLRRDPRQPEDMKV